MKILAALTVLIILSSCGGSDRAADSDEMIDEFDYKLCSDQGGEIIPAKNGFVCYYGDNI